MRKIALLLAICLLLPSALLATGLDFDVTRPYGTDTVSSLDDYLRETRLDVMNFGIQEHYTTGVHKIPSATTAQLPDIVASTGRLIYNTTAGTLLFGKNDVWVSTNGSLSVPYVLISSYSNSLTAAVTAIGADKVTLVIDASATLSAATVVPENVSLWFIGDGEVVLGDYNLTLAGLITAPSAQIFDYSGSGVVSFTGKQDAVRPSWFPGVDIGAKINAAIAAVPAASTIPIAVAAEEWCGATYATGIVVNKPVRINFPGLRNTTALYTGTVAGIKLTSHGVTLSGGVHLSLLGNTNATADGLVFYGVSDCLVSDGITIDYAPRRCISIDAAGVGAYQNVLNGSTRLMGANTGGILLWIGDSVGGFNANANMIEHLVLASIPNAGAGVHLVSGYTNQISHMYSNGGLTADATPIAGDGTCWGVVVALGVGGNNYFGSATIEGMGNGIYALGGGTHFGQLKINVLGVDESVDRPTAGLSYTYGTNLYTENCYARYFAPMNIATSDPASPGVAAPVLYSTAGGGAYPYDEVGNLIIMPRASESYARDVVVRTGLSGSTLGTTIAFTRTGAIQGLRTTNGPVGTCTLADGAYSTTVPNSNITANSKVFLMPTTPLGAAAQSNNPGVWHASNLAGVGFTLGHTNTAGATATFDYLIVN